MGQIEDTIAEMITFTENLQKLESLARVSLRRGNIDRETYNWLMESVVHDGIRLTKQGKRFAAALRNQANDTNIELLEEWTEGIK